MTQISSPRTRTLPEHRLPSADERVAAGTSRPLWFGSATAPLFGFYHAPRVTDFASARRLGIVLCPPFGYEAMCSYRPYRRLAEQLAEAGFPVLRFDYHGTGSSDGDDRHAGRVQAWIQSIHAALDEIETLSGCSRFALFGARLGANLAAVAADSRDDVVALTLWGPTLTGNTFLREELAVHKLRAQQLSAARQSVPPSVDGGEALGFVLTAETTAAIKAINLANLSRAPSSALVLTRDTPLQEARVAKRLEELGARVRCEPATGYAAMIDDSVAPADTFRRILDYFDEQDLALGDDLPCVLEATPLEPAAARFSSTGDLRETAAWFGPERRLFGVLTRDFTRERRDAPVIVLLSGGVNPQVGTNRMHTRWARAWAELGLTTFRFDLGGIGDSATRDGETEGQLYTMAGIVDVQAAMNHLGDELGARQFMLIGLCSGAFVAFHTALSDPRVTHLGMLNLLRFYWNPEQTIEQVQAERRHQLRSVRYYLSAAGRREHWEKLIRGRVELGRIGQHLFQRSAHRVLNKAGYWLSKVAGTSLDILPAHPLAADFRRLAKRGVSSVVVYDGEEPMLDDFREQLGSNVPLLAEQGRLQLEVIDGADHIFSPVASQETLSERLTDYLRARFLNEARA